MRILKFIFLIITIILFSCEGEETVQPTPTPPVEIVQLTTFSPSPNFPEAELLLNPPQTMSIPTGTMTVSVTTFNYNVKNYELATQTTDAPTKGIANSADGQHIHLILNNQPYLAKYTSIFAESLPIGHYLALSFLSRSYYESIKTEKAHKVTQFYVGQPKEAEFDLTQPLLFYSRPKGEYTGVDTEKILLDFYLVNTAIAPDGNSVKLTIDNTLVFSITEWKPYFITGLSIGEHTLRMELLDKSGKTIAAPFTPIERTITLTQ